MKRTRNLINALLLTGMLAATGCTTVIGVQPGQFPPAPPTQAYPAAPVDGTVYQPATALSFVSDVKARRIGDTITIVLSERTQAS